VTEGPKIYDIAVSFAGAQRTLVEPVVRACQDAGLTVFYDRDNTVEFWGRNFITGMREIYGGTRARYVVPFLSEEYLASAYPMDEFTTAMQRAIEISADSYLLPIIIGSVQVPSELLNPAIAYLRLEDHTPGQLAQIIAARVGAARERHQEPREVMGVVDDTFGVRLPRLPPTAFSPLETLENALARVGALFQGAADQLTPFGMRCLVRVSGTAVDVRVERQGGPVCRLRLYFDDGIGGDRLLMAFQWPVIIGNGHNGWVTAEWDTDAGRPGLQFTDLALAGGPPSIVTADELFHRLWGKIVEYLECVRG
jgi:hypothetical protein